MTDVRAATEDIVAHARRFGTDSTEVEIKSGGGGLPRTTAETVSAFANGRGGTLIIGLAEESHFAPVDGFAPRRIADALADVCSNKLVPPIRDAIEFDELEGAPVVRLDVTEIDPRDKPCFVEARGEYNGSFIRSADGDRRLSRYEVTQLLSNRRQPDDDAQPVAAASFSDLDPQLVNRLVARVRQRNLRVFGGLDNVEVLRLLNAVTDVDEQTKPTLAGLLCLGNYPQRYFPQLFISVVVVPGTAMGDTTPDGRRFLDNVTVDGPLPLAVEEALAAVRRNMRTAVTVHQGRRVDHYDYPLDVIRELIVNAVLHRDYSAESLGAKVQIELYQDRLDVKSPGGLYGAVDIEQLGTENVSSSRNAVLARLLSELPAGDDSAPLCESRGSGLPAVVAALREAGMSPPDFDVAPGHVYVHIPQHALLGPEMIKWMSMLSARGLTGPQHLALAMMRTNGSVSKQMLRVWGVDRLAATQALTDLVTRGLATKSGGRRYAHYRLVGDVDPQQELNLPLPPDSNSRSRRVENELAATTEAIRAGHDTARLLEAALSLGYQTVLRRINTLVERGVIEHAGGAGRQARMFRLCTGAR